VVVGLLPFPAWDTNGGLLAGELRETGQRC